MRFSSLSTFFLLVLFVVVGGCGGTAVVVNTTLSGSVVSGSVVSGSVEIMTGSTEMTGELAMTGEVLDLIQDAHSLTGDDGAILSQLLSGDELSPEEKEAFNDVLKSIGIDEKTQK